MTFQYYPSLSCTPSYGTRSGPRGKKRPLTSRRQSAREEAGENNLSLSCTPSAGTRRGPHGKHGPWTIVDAKVPERRREKTKTHIQHGCVRCSRISSRRATGFETETRHIPKRVGPVAVQCHGIAAGADSLKNIFTVRYLRMQLYGTVHGLPYVWRPLLSCLVGQRAPHHHPV